MVGLQKFNGTMFSLIKSSLQFVAFKKFHMDMISLGKEQREKKIMKWRQYLERLSLKGRKNNSIQTRI